MSVEQELISHIDSLESDKDNEDSPDDLSNIVGNDIVDSKARLEQMIELGQLSDEQAESLRK